MDLRELRYFQHVAELKSFSKASIQLRIAQPALSRQVRKLEDELGVQLFVRAGRGLELTEPGATLLQRAHSLLRQVSQISDDVRAQASSVAGRVTLGVPPAAGELLIPPVIGRCRELFPGIHIDVVEGFSGFLHERLLRQELSLCVLHNPAPHRDIDIEPVLVEHMYLVGPGPGAEGVPPASEDCRLEDLPLILPSKPHSLRMLVEGSVTARGGRLRLAQQVDGLVLIRALVAAGLGYTVLTYGSVHRQVEQGQLSAVLLLHPEIAWTLCIARRNDQRVARPVQAVAEIIRAEVHQLVDEGKWRGAPQYPEDAA